MALGDIFKLAKLAIEPFEDVDRKRPAGKPIEVQYNPDSLSMRHETVFQGMQGLGTGSKQARFSHSRSNVLSVKLVLDGSGADLLGVQRITGATSVADRVDAFLGACYDKEGKIHEPHYLRLRWGSRGVLGNDFHCRLQSVDVRYTAFARDGAPLHAELDATFVEDLSPERKAAEERMSSPDLPHRVTVVEGDTLPLLCLRIYGSPEHYPRVAEVNGLDDVRELRPGQELMFPPFDSARGQRGER